MNDVFMFARKGRESLWWRRLSGVLFPLALCLVQAVANAGDQPQWGQRYSRNMISDEKGLADCFDPATGQNIKYVIELGSETYSTPIVAGGRIYIGTNNERPRDKRYQGDRGVFMCFDEKDGRFLWQLVVPKYSTDMFTDWPKAGICSPATVEGDKVYILSNRGEALCVDRAGLANGNDGPFTNEPRFVAPRDTEPQPLGPTDADILWAFDIHGTVGTHPHDAAHSSFLLHGQFLYINTGNGLDNKHKTIPRPDGPSVIVLEKQTGRLVAMDDEHIGPRIFHNTYSSPSLGEVNGKTLVFFGGGDGVVYAFEALTAPPPPGQVLKLKKVWQFDCDPTAPKAEVHRYISNRKESPSNIKSMTVFYRHRVYVTVGGDVWWGKNQAWLKCIDATKTGDITKTGELWSYPLTEHCMSTPAIYNGLVLVADCGRRVHCVDAETGQPYWTHETKGTIWASTLVADDKVYIGTRRGDFWILAASKQKQVLCSVEMGHPISATATAANGALYIATMRKLYAIQKTTGEPAATATP